MAMAPMTWRRVHPSLLSTSSPRMQEASMNPIRYPPVGPTRAAAPAIPLNMPNAAPIPRYSPCPSAPYLPRTAAPRRTTSTWPVKGTGVNGSTMRTWAAKAMSSARKRAAQTFVATLDLSLHSYRWSEAWPRHPCTVSSTCMAEAI